MLQNNFTLCTNTNQLPVKKLQFLAYPNTINNFDNEKELNNIDLVFRIIEKYHYNPYEISIQLKILNLKKNIIMISNVCFVIEMLIFIYISFI